MIDPIKVEHQGLEYLGYVFANDHTGQFVPYVQIRDMTLAEPMYENDTIDGPQVIGSPLYRRR